jgi:sugar-specific transcriptional regulator TrmB
MIEEILIQNGFSPKEAKVYLAILEIGEATMSMIARKAKIERSTVYDVVNDLQQKGFAFITVRKRLKYVSPISPSVLIGRFKNSATRAESILPDLLDLAYKSPLKPRIKFFEGLDGIKLIFKEFSQTNEETYVFTDYEIMPRELRQFIWDEIIPERKRRNSYARLLIPDSPENRIEKAKDVNRFAEHKLISFPKNQTISLEIILYENMTGFMCFEKNEMFGLLIDSQTINHSLKSIFLYIWNSVK